MDLLLGKAKKRSQQYIELMIKCVDFQLFIIQTFSCRISLYTGGSFAAVIGILLILLYLPSTCSTILKLRCGMIASLHDEHMNKYRSSADTICYNISNMMYGLVGAMTLFLTFFGGIIFLFLWNPTNQFMMSVLAWGLGLTITMTVKTVLVKICRKAQYQSFYRKRPRSANLVSLAMECWTLGVAGGALVGRLTQFLLASAFWIGRIDVNYLDDDVNLLGYRFDTVPTHYRKEILGTLCSSLLTLHQCILICMLTRASNYVQHVHTENDK